MMSLFKQIIALCDKMQSKEDMKVISIVKYTFTLAGIGLLVGAFYTFWSTNIFITEAINTKGTIVRFDHSRSDSSRPVVQFYDRNGQLIEFSSSVGSSLPIYSKGEKVEVLYSSKNSQNAKINDFLSLWSGSIMLLAIGSPFVFIGLTFIFAVVLKNRKVNYLRQSGVPIETELLSVELNASFSINGKHPFRILTQWQNPSTSEHLVFVSDNIWFDPSDYMENNKITVFVARDNLQKYDVDLSFLPKPNK